MALSVAAEALQTADRWPPYRSLEDRKVTTSVRADSAACTINSVVILGAGKPEHLEGLARPAFNLAGYADRGLRERVRTIVRSFAALRMTVMNSIPFRILATDHTGLTVRDIERSLAFWRDVLGFEVSHRAHHTGDLARKVTGVPGAEILIVVLKAPGHRIELLQYLAPAGREQVPLRPCDVGAAHVALLVDNLDAVLETIAASGWQAAGQTQTLTSGPNAGRRVIYVRDPDGTTIELMQPQPRPT